LIDLHCHILPGIDDGAQNMFDSISMAKQAVNEGIHSIVATPHFNRTYKNSKQLIIEKVDLLNEALKRENINLVILPGQESRIDGNIIDGINNEEIITLAGSSYLLIEFPSTNVPRYVDQLFYDLQNKGITPIIAHPERNQEIIEHPDLIYRLVKNGALSQVTAASLTGSFGKKIKLFSEQLVEFNLAHFIASDAHNTSSRGFKLREGYEVIKSVFGTDYEFSFKENSECLINNFNIQKEIPERIKRKKLFGIF
jgi:protein-tyrosine phosphatase